LAWRGKYLRFVIGGLVLLAIVVGALLIGDSSAKPKPKEEVANNTIQTACGPYRNDKTVTIGSTNIKAEVPKNSTEFAKGLGGRPCILPDQGMLFAFTQPGHYPFWMKSMKFPVDIIWISTDHKVAAMEINESPSTYPDKFVNRDNLAQYVLELKANRAQELNLGLGSVISF
jgi:uncharacterized membrane protein (UPF0127 family)